MLLFWKEVCTELISMCAMNLCEITLKDSLPLFLIAPKAKIFLLFETLYMNQ